MRLVFTANEEPRVELPGEQAQPARRIDRYTKPPRWFWQSAEEVEIWQLADGRQVRASRHSQAADWELRWR
ncbi:hypothetical protein [Deinococcus gobiensis]|uniref:hypothetical protein n=1 Tax=Deinococcus gobiensis TaxID=502394 RepID=UPI0005C16455|nr:hypothetical protein [Deinococcus gobiensis]